MEKSCTTRDVSNSVNNGIFTISAGAGFQPSTVVYIRESSKNDRNNQVPNKIIQPDPVYSDAKRRVTPVRFSFASSLGQVPKKTWMLSSFLTTGLKQRCKWKGFSLSLSLSLSIYIYVDD